MSATPRKLATTTEVAEFLDIQPATLRQWRYLGRGPRFTKVGRSVRYDWRAVDKWLDQQARGGAA